MASSTPPNWQSVVLVGIMFLIALGSMIYISSIGEKEDVGEIILAKIKILESSTTTASPEGLASRKTVMGNEEKKSIIDCENMVPLELQSPRFLGTIPNVTVTKGENVSIPCVVENLGVFRLAWLKLHSQTILTIHNHIITRNMRIGLSIESQTLETPCKNRKIETAITMYTLNIHSVQEKDEGFYMCQTNTDPLKGQWGFLKVEVPIANSSEEIEQVESPS